MDEFFVTYLELFLAFWILIYAFSALGYVSSLLKKMQYEGQLLMRVMWLLLVILTFNQATVIMKSFFGERASLRILTIALDVIIIIGLLLTSFQFNKDFLRTFFNIRPALETSIDPRFRRKRKFNLKSSYSYLSEEAKPVQSYEAFMNEIAEGSHGLIITRDDPKRVREKYSLKATPIIQLTADFTRKMRLENLSARILDFVHKSKDAVIVIDCLDRIILDLDFNQAYQFVQLLRDHVMKTNSRMIVFVNPAGIDDKQLAMLRNETEPLSSAETH